MKEPNRFHDNLIGGYGSLDSSRPLDFHDPLNSPRVYGRPTNLRQIVSFWGRIKAAWLVLTLNAIAVRWYDEDNANQYGRSWHEWAHERDREQQGRRTKQFRFGSSASTEIPGSWMR